MCMYTGVRAPGCFGEVRLLPFSFLQFAYRIVSSSLRRVATEPGVPYCGRPLPARRRHRHLRAAAHQREPEPREPISPK
eukprot:SAG11_NODE_22024_length_413_cov_4.547771_2_plen_78_part_01